MYSLICKRRVRYSRESALQNYIFVCFVIPRFWKINTKNRRSLFCRPEIRFMVHGLRWSYPPAALKALQRPAADPRKSSRTPPRSRLGKPALRCAASRSPCPTDPGARRRKSLVLTKTCRDLKGMVKPARAARDLHVLKYILEATQKALTS